MEIQELFFGRFHAAEHVQFGTEFCSLIEGSPIKAQLPQYAGYKALHDEELMIFNKETANALTPEMEHADATRDSHTYGFMLAFRSAQHHYLPDMVATANVVAFTTDSYKEVREMPYNEKTALLTDMVAALQASETATAVDKMGLTAWVKQIDADNQHFANLMMQRSSMSADVIEGTMLDIRSRIDPEYKTLVKRINALVILDDKGTYTELVKLINERIDYYKRTISERIASAETKKAKE